MCKPVECFIVYSRIVFEQMFRDTVLVGSC